MFFDHAEAAHSSMPCTHCVHYRAVTPTDKEQAAALTEHAEGGKYSGCRPSKPVETLRVISSQLT